MGQKRKKSEPQRHEERKERQRKAVNHRENREKQGNAKDTKFTKNAKKIS
jgi:hypothetical protein